MFYTEDIVFDCRVGKYVGKDAIQEWFLDIHPEGVLERLNVTNMLIEGDKAAVEIDTYFTFSKDLPDYFLGPVSNGDIFNLKLAGFYRIRDNKISYANIYERGDPVKTRA